MYRMCVMCRVGPHRVTVLRAGPGSLPTVLLTYLPPPCLFRACAKRAEARRSESGAQGGVRQATRTNDVFRSYLTSCTGAPSTEVAAVTLRAPLRTAAAPV